MQPNQKRKLGLGLILSSRRLKGSIVQSLALLLASQGIGHPVYMDLLKLIAGQVRQLQMGQGVIVRQANLGRFALLGRHLHWPHRNEILVLPLTNQPFLIVAEETT